MTRDEKLDHILAICREGLALAAKRTPGEWEAGKRKDEYIVYCGPAKTWDPQLKVITDHKEDDAAYIAHCAGLAEAGWRATIAAIEGLRAADKVWEDMERTGEDFWVSGDAWAFDLLTIAHNQLDNIIAAYFPKEDV